MNWRFARFEDLTVREVHDIYQARVGVFVLEQNCPFQDLDGADPECWHLVGKVNGELFAYCRLLPPGLKFPEPSIGRVLTTSAARGKGTGRALMKEAVARAQDLWPGRPIRIGAQQYLEKFYGEFGFERFSDMYLEDGIPHIEMIRK